LAESIALLLEKMSGTQIILTSRNANLLSNPIRVPAQKRVNNAIL